LKRREQVQLNSIVCLLLKHILHLFSLKPKS
jgi:hypothetical protein